MNFKNITAALMLFATLGLASCGGGGGSDPATGDPAVRVYTIGGTVTGLSGTGLVLSNNGIDLPVDGSSFIFPAIADGSDATVTVKTQPSNPAQECAVSQDGGTIAGADVTNVLVSCTMKLVSIAVVPTDPFIAKGFDQQMTATGTYSDGSTQDLTSAVTWSSSDSSKITVGQASGLASFVKVGGPVTITAYGPDNIKGEVTIPARNVMFTTSASGDAILGNWMVNGSSITNGQTGLAAADAICANLAQAAGHSGTFKAWLSDDTDDAYCRVAGVSGKKSANCGQSAMPTDSGPWVRTDGYPFTDGLSQYLVGNTPRLYTPPILNESGAKMGDQLIFTASDARGVKSTSQTTCLNWTDTANNVSTTLRTTTTRITVQNVSCSTGRQLACFQVGAGAPLPLLPSGGKKVFVTSTTGSGNLGGWSEVAGTGKTGIAAGDAICQARALAANIPNAANFKAWLSDSTIAAKDRFSNTTEPYVRLDGVKVADNLAALSSANLFSAISVTESGSYENNFYVWTGTAGNGTASALTCSDWTDGQSTANGTIGVDFVNSWFTDSGAPACNSPYRLYCLEN